MFKKLAVLLLAAVSFACCSMSFKDVKSEEFIRAQAVQIVAEKGSCSGTQVRLANGHRYILTAGHCRGILKEKDAHVVDSNYKSWKAEFVAEDPRSDLMLLKAIPGFPGLEIADKIYRKEHIRTFTHGHAFDTYMTAGEIIQSYKMKIFMNAITTPAEEKACKLPKNRIEDAMTFFGQVKVCLLELTENVGTAAIVPGSSGGMVVDDAGDIVGVVSAGERSNPIFGYYIQLKDIKRFLRRR